MTVDSTLPFEKQKKYQLLARLTGLMFIITFATSIPPVVLFYVPALSDPAFVTSGGFDRGVSMGAFLELLLIAANIGTALTLYPILRNRFPVLSLGYVTARLVECGFIAMGIISLMALNTLRMKGATLDESALLAVGQSLVAIHDWTFRIGPGVVVGVGNGLILSYMMWKSRLVPRAMSILGLIGGPALLIAGFAVLFGYIEPASTPQIIATVPEFFWELSLGVWLLLKGFNRQALADLESK
jgi:Domain of unknown function (DUF4386)